MNINEDGKMEPTDSTIDMVIDVAPGIQTNDLKYPLIKQNLVTAIGPFTIDKVIFDTACKDFWRVVFPSFATKICGRMMMLHHIIASNAASLAYLSTNLVAAGYIAAISAGIEFFLKLYELYNDENKVTKLEKFKSASAIALKTGIKFFMVYMSWVLGTCAMTTLGAMAGPYLALGIIGVGVATALGLALATLLTETLPIIWKPIHKQYSLHLRNKLKISTKHRKLFDDFFKNLCESKNISHDDKETEISKEDLIAEINKDENKKIKEVLYQKGYDFSDDFSDGAGDDAGYDLSCDSGDDAGYDLSCDSGDGAGYDFSGDSGDDAGYDLSCDSGDDSGDDLSDDSGLRKDLRELTNIINSGYHYKPSKLFSKFSSIDFILVKKSILRGFLEGIFWSFIEHNFNETHPREAIDVATVSVAVSSCFLIGGILDSLYWKGGISNYLFWNKRKEKVKAQLNGSGLDTRLKSNLDKEFENITPDDIYNTLRLSQRVKNSKVKNLLLIWVKNTVALKLNPAQDQQSNAGQDQESNAVENAKWHKFEPLINKPRAANSFGFFCGTTKTAKTKEIGELHQNIDKARDGLGEVLELAH